MRGEMVLTQEKLDAQRYTSISLLLKKDLDNVYPHARHCVIFLLFIYTNLVDSFVWKCWLFQSLGIESVVVGRFAL